MSRPTGSKINRKETSELPLGGLLVFVLNSCQNVEIYCKIPVFCGIMLPNFRGVIGIFLFIFTKIHKLFLNFSVGFCYNEVP